MLRFNFYYSFPFWASFVLVAILFRLFRPSGQRKAYSLLVFSSVMLLALPRLRWSDYLVIVSTTALTYLIGFRLSRGQISISSRRKRLTVILGILAVLSFLAFFKYHFIQDLLLNRQSSPPPNPPDYLFLIGVSYFSFKMIHFLVECFRGKTAQLDILVYFNYILFFPSFISGPINRYNQFYEQMTSTSRGAVKADLKLGLERIIHGLFKKFVLVQLLYPHILTNAAKPLDQLAASEIVIGLYAYAFYFYFDFSAYSDLAIGCARVLGIELPENFNRPYLKRNIRELWMNWHMSFTGWLVEYIYWPLVRKLRNIEFFKRHSVMLANTGMVITFIICGMWHGETLNFILWGAYHGIGISIVNIYQRGKRKIKSRFLQRYFLSKYSQAFGTLLTFNFFTLGLLFFVLDRTKLLMMIKDVISQL